MIRILLVEDDDKLSNKIDNYFKNDNKITLLAIANNGQEAIKYLSKEIDIILLDYVMPIKDGYGFIKYMKDNNINKNVILMSEYRITNMANIIEFDNLNYFMLKPIDLNDLRSVIININNKVYNNNNMNLKITKLLNNLGMPSNLEGFKYVRYAIIYAYNKNEDIKIKEVYIVIASDYNTTISKVERDMRSAICISTDRADNDLMIEIFGNSINKDKGTPTNSEYIFTIVDKLKIGMI